jgi:hypothetical protein
MPVTRLLFMPWERSAIDRVKLRGRHFIVGVRATRGASDRLDY